MVPWKRLLAVSLIIIVAILVVDFFTGKNIIGNTKAVVTMAAVVGLVLCIAVLALLPNAPRIFTGYGPGGGRQAGKFNPSDPALFA